MKDKYIKYINYIASDIELPYLKSLEPYWLKQDEMKLVLSTIFNQPVRIRGNSVIGEQEKIIYNESTRGYWEIKEHSKEGHLILWKNSYGTIRKWDNEGNLLYEEIGYR